MKNILMIILSLLLCLSLVACDTPNKCNESGEMPTADNPESSIKEESLAMNISVVYSPNNSMDRALVSLECLKRRISLSLDEDRGCALCLVTVVNINLEDVTSTEGSRVPLTLRIDKVLSSNESFTLKEGESFLTAEYSFWVKKGDEYSVRYADGSVPITESGSQYIVMLTEEGAFDDIDFDIEYRTECYSVPINTSNVSANKIATQYAEMRLPEDVRKLSVALIKEVFGESFIPSFDEIEAILKEIVG